MGKNSSILRSSPASQRGVVLIVGLIMVLLITIVGLASIRGSGLQESMAGNMRERNLAFQACESALLEGEAIPAGGELPAFNGADGLHLDLNTTPTGSVIYFDKDDWEANAKMTDLELDMVASQPSYVVEELDIGIGDSAVTEGSGADFESLQIIGDATPYRITCQGVGASENSQVVLQSTYKRRFQ